jgi:hypothetical protein
MFRVGKHDRVLLITAVAIIIYLLLHTALNKPEAKIEYRRYVVPEYIQSTAPVSSHNSNTANSTGQKIGQTASNVGHNVVSGLQGIAQGAHLDKLPGELQKEADKIMNSVGNSG